VLVKVLACGVCRTDLHVIDGELPNTAIPIVPGHEIVGRVEAVGRQVTTHAPWGPGRYPVARLVVRRL
jgi:propanol-preferring alcohol dehydrogenase